MNSEHLSYQKNKIAFLQGMCDLQLQTINGIVLTHREIDIIACIMSGRAAKKIAFFLSISPKTVENHIRNIMLKLGCRTQESIIDFVEKSNNFASLKKHYSNLLIRFIFETALKKMSIHAIENNLSCLLVCSKEDQDKTLFLAALIHHLKIARIKISIKNNEEDEINKLESNDFTHIIYIVPGKWIEKNQTSHDKTAPGFSYALQLSNVYSLPIISLFLNRSISSNIPESFVNVQYLDLTEQGNYYFFVFEILKKLLPAISNASFLEFKKQYAVLSDPSFAIKSFDENTPISALPSTNTTNKRYKIFIIIFCVLLCITCLTVFAYFLVEDDRDKERKNTAIKIFFNWINEKEYLYSKIAEKYIEILEGEESKLGNLDGKIQTLNFLNLKKNFIAINNTLIKLDPSDKEETKKLVEFLKKTFPVNSKLNEKIHKLVFLVASYHGKLSFIQELLENNPISFLDFKDYYGNTAPMLAAASNNVTTFEWLVKKDALFINHKNIEGNSALILATLSLQDDENLTDDEKNKSITIIKKVLEYDQNSLKTSGHKGCTALLIAGAKGNIAAIKYLLEMMAPGDTKRQKQILEEEKNLDENNILLLAAYNGKKHVIEWLYEQEIYMQPKNRYNTTVLMQATSGGSVETMDLIYRIHQKSQSLNINSKNAYTKQDPDVLTERNNFGHTALFLAAYGNKLNAFQWILEKLKDNFNNNGKNIVDYIRNERNSDGDTLLHVLITGMSNSSSIEIRLNTGLLDILLNYIDVNIYTTSEQIKTGHTPLMRAASHGNLAIVKYLIEKCGADITGKTNAGKTAVHFAVMEGRDQYQEVVEYLLKQQAIKEGKSLNEMRNKSKTSLFLTAAEYGQKAVMKWLLKNDPELINSCDENGDNALSLAIKNFYIDAIEFIFDWNKNTAVQLMLEKRTNASENILEGVILEEKNGKNKDIRLSRYLEQKIGISVNQLNQKSTSHSDPDYKWKPLEIDIDGLSTCSVQPWSPYYVNYDYASK